MKKPNAFDLDIPIPSKKNSMQVRFHPTFWKAIATIVSRFRQLRQKTYWIGPSDAVKDAEQIVAWTAAIALDNFPGLVRVTILLDRRVQDIDNALGVIFDGIEKSGRITNDKQISSLVLDRADLPGKVTARVTVEEL